MAKKKVIKTLERRAAAGSKRAARRLANKTGGGKKPGKGKGSPMPTGPIGSTGSSTGAGTPFVTPPKTPFPQINKAAGKAAGVLGVGSSIGKELLPEVFAGGSGLDRATLERVQPHTTDFSNINQYLQPSVDDAMGFRDDTAGRYDELLGMRRDRLGGLDTAENMALKESLHRDIDRQRQGALRDVARTPGLGAGASFAQRRAIGRDASDAGIGANRQLLLDNVNIRRQALGDFEGTTGARTAALGSANDRVAGLRGLQATGRQATDQFNSGVKTAADQFNSTGKFAVDQFNAGQQKAELGARVGAVSTGTGLLGDERDNIAAKKKQDELLAFLKERDQTLFNQAQGLFG